MSPSIVSLARLPRPARQWSLANPSAVAVLVGACLALIVLSATGWRLWEERQQGFEREAARVELLAAVMDEQATRSFETAAVVMASLSELAGDTLADAVTPELQAGMAQALVSQPFMRSLALVDASGLVLESTSRADAGIVLDLVALRAPAVEGRAGIGPWLAGRNLADLARGSRSGRAPPGVGMVPFSLRFTGKGGHSLLLVAMLNPDALLGLQHLALDGGGRVAVLASHDGQVLATAQGESPVSQVLPGGSVARHPVFTRLLASRSHGAFSEPGLEAGPAVGAWQASRSQRLVVIVERPVALLQAVWLRHIVPLLAITALILAAFSAMTLAAWRSLHGREAAQRQLREQFDLTAMILEISPMPVSMLDGSGRYVAVNKAWEEFMWRDRSKVIGQPAGSAMSPAEAALHDARDAELRSRGGKLRYEAAFTHPDGSTRDLLVSKVAVRGAGGLLDSVLCATVDITEFREAERATREARDAAEESSRSKSEFIANVSHELRTPLQSIIGFSELGMHAGMSSERMATMFSHVNASGERMLSLVNDLLDVAKQENAQQACELAPGDLRGLVHSALTEVAPLASRAGLRLQVDLPATPMLARIDSQRMLQVVLNVLANAVKFSPPGSCVTVRGESGVDGHLLSVRDEGPGIPEAELASIFEPFVQSTRTKDGSGGTGLGLAICRKIMQAHGGSIEARNAAGGGALLLIALPAA